MNTYYLILLLAAGLFGYLADVRSECLTFNDTYVMDGESFSPPGTDECTSCLCKNGKALKCNTLECDMPINTDCRSYIQVDGCCQYECQEPEPGEEYNGSNGATDYHSE